MKKFVFIILTVSVLRAEAVPSFQGGNGLVFIRTANLLLKKHWNTGLFSDFRFYSIPSAHKVSFYEPSPDYNIKTVFNYGIINGLETGFVFPFYIQKDVHDLNGLGNIQVNLRYSPLTGKGGNFNLAFTGYMAFPSATDRNYLGSGEVNGGGEVNFTTVWNASKSFMTHFNLGMDYWDYFEENFSNEEAKLVAATRITGSVGLEITPIHWLTLMGELWGWRVFYNRDDSLNATLGLRFLPHKNVAITVAGAFGVAGSWRSNDDYIGAIGISYISEEARPTLPSPPPPKPVKPEVPKKEEKKTRVKILNSCESEDAVLKVIQYAKALEYDIVGTGKSGKKVEITTIYFNPGSMKEALELSRLIPGRQKLLKLKAPMETAEILVITACDIIPEKKPAVPPEEKPVQPEKPTPSVPEVKPPPPPPPPVKKSFTELRIGVFNACGRPGLATEAAKKLILRGLNVTQVGNAEVSGLQRTRVRYLPGYREDATVLGFGYSSNPELIEDPNLKDLEVSIEVGCEYRP